MTIFLFKVSRILFVGVSFFLLLSTTGCKPEKMADPKGALEVKATEYWKGRLLNKDYKAIYDMELNKSMIPYEEYLNLVKNAGQIVYLNIRIEDVSVEGEKGILLVKGKWQIPAVPEPVWSSIRDHWVVRDNQWKHVLRTKKKK